MNRRKFVVDVLVWTLATPLAFWMRLDTSVVDHDGAVLTVTLLQLPFKAIIVWWSGIHRQVFHRISVRDALAIARWLGAYAVFGSAASLVAVKAGMFWPRSSPWIEALTAMVALAAVRLGARVRHEVQGRRSAAGTARRVLIVGAGEAGSLVAREMSRHPEAGLLPAGFLDDDPAKRHARVAGVPVLGTIDDLPQVVAVKEIDEIVIAMPSAPGPVVRRVVETARAAGCRHRIVPGIYDLLSGRVPIAAIRDVDVTDLLRREPVMFDTREVAGYLGDKRVLVTGAGGSIGSELVRQILGFRPSRLVLVGHGENSLHQISEEIRQRSDCPALRLVVADVRDGDRISRLFAEERPQVVFHAAAHKHVPLMEDNPDEAVLNNVVGTRNVVTAAVANQVSHFVNISTDKAVNPSSVMGATKRLGEIVVQHASQRAAAGSVYVSVRFGNVLGSRGSVVPVFRRQIAAGGPVTITHPDMTRFFMTIPEASRLVLQAASLHDSGVIYVLDMGEPVRIVDLARDLIRLSGFEPDVDIAIQVTGIRPGEKLHEELFTDPGDAVPSALKKIFVARTRLPDAAECQAAIDRLIASARAGELSHNCRGLLDLARSKGVSFAND